MGYTISKEFAFSASHILSGLPPDHPCSRLHGHNYRVEVVLAVPHLSPVGFIRDYRALDPFKRFLNDTFDHQHLNDLLDVNPTAEHLAAYLFAWCAERWPETVAVRVSETPTTWASYYREDR